MINVVRIRVTKKENQRRLTSNAEYKMREQEKKVTKKLLKLLN